MVVGKKHGHQGTGLFGNLIFALWPLGPLVFISLPWKPEFCMDLKHLKEIWWCHWEDAFCEVSSQLTHWLLRRKSWCMTDAEQKAITITQLEQSTDELKIENLYNWMDNLWLKVENIEQFLLLSICLQKAVCCRGIRKRLYAGKG